MLLPVVLEGTHRCLYPMSSQILAVGVLLFEFWLLFVCEIRESLFVELLLESKLFRSGDEGFTILRLDLLPGRTSVLVEVPVLASLLDEV